MKKIQLRKDEIKRINQEIEIYGIEINKKDRVELVEDKVILVNSQPKLFFFEEKTVPLLREILNNSNIKMKKVIVDMGAVKFVTSGADVMRPGIVKIEDNIENGDLILIVDETHVKPLAIGKSLYSSKELNEKQTGKVIKSIHYIGDEIWNHSA